MAKPDKRWFEQRIADKGWSMRRISIDMRLGADGLHKRLNGTRTVTASEAAALAHYISQPLDEVMRRLGHATDKNAKNPVTIVGVVDATGLVVNAPKKMHIADRPPRAGADTVALRVQALSSPLDGWVAFYVPSTDVSTDAVGRLSVSELADGSRYLRILQRGYDRGRWNLHALADGPALENVDVRWAAPVSFIAC